MLEIVRDRITSPQSSASFDVEIASVATAVPEHVITQEEVTKRAKLVFPHLARMEALYTNTGIDTRYSCEPADWYHKEHGWEERTASFQHHALELLERVAHGAVAEAGIDLKDISGLIINTITGLAIPSLDARLMNRLDLPHDIERLPIFGLGCGGGVAGLGRAVRMAQSMAGGHVLFLTVDLCSLCMRVNDPSMAMFVSTALFGDGAAGVVLRNTAGRESGDGNSTGRIVAVGEHFWPDTEHIMGWDIKEDGFGVVLSPDLVPLMRHNLGPAVQSFFQRSGLSMDGMDGFIFHTGGRKILEVVEQVLELDRDDLRHSWAVLRDYGNMSSATALFVLHRARAQKASGRHLMVAFGPGFSAYFVVADL